jgi:hypothetical protein
MSKKISFSCPEFLWEMYLRDIIGNRSEQICKYLVIGMEAEIGEEKSLKSKYLILLQKYNNLQDKHKKQALVLAKYKKQKEEDPYRQQKLMIDGFLANNPLRESM